MRYTGMPLDTARRPLGRAAFAALVVTTGVISAFAQEPAPPAAAAVPATDLKTLAKATQNPVGDLVALPFQFNFNTGGDLEDRTLFNVNFQPVVPFKVSEHWSVIARTVVPMDSVPLADGRSSGIGDLQEQVYITPATPGKIIWGAGPVFSLPTATAQPLATGTWAVGPGAVVVANVGEIVLGGLVNQFWPLSDSGEDNETNLFVVQPFINYNFGTGWALAFAPLISANWDAPSGNQWTVPLGIGLTRTTVFNRRPMSLGVQYYYNVERPDGAAATQLRFVVSFLYPKPHHASGR